MIIPRASTYGGARIEPTIMLEGTWLEPESLCYPDGRMARRAKALCEDGSLRVVACGLPDTFSTITAAGGYLEVISGTLHFRKNKLG